MDKTATEWTRREFMRGAAAVVALPHWLPQADRAGFAYVASANDSIHAFATQNNHWSPLQEIASITPSAIAIRGNTLYAANDVNRFDRLPRGSVQCFRIAVDGRLTTMGRVPLSLSATHPRNLAVSPDGKLLAVASQADGIYNLFAIAEDGRLKLSNIFKDTGCAHPHSLRFDPTGTRIFSSEADGDRTAVFAVENGRLIRAAEDFPTPAEADPVRITEGSIYYRTVKVADVPAAKSVAIKT